MQLMKFANTVKERLDQIDRDIMAANKEFNKRNEKTSFWFKNGLYSLEQLKEILDHLGEERSRLAPLWEYYEDKLETVY